MNSHKFFQSILAHPMCRLLLKLMAFLLWPVVSLAVEPAPEAKPATPKAAELEETESINSDDSCDHNDLFPSISNCQQLPSSIKPCSTDASAKFMAYKNEQGEMEWTFAEDLYDNLEQQPQPKLSPTISNSSNNESIISQKFNETPSSLASQTPSPPFSPSNTDNKLHQCPHCEATFKLRGYLTRHVKKHAIKKAYSCPFHKFSIYVDENNTTHKCHPSGGFSRRDTYKTHLKSRHFKYPKGTKTKQRGSSAGNCSMCGEYFDNSEIWCELHIEGGECKFLPVGFKGKSRIKNRLKKQLTQTMKKNKKMISTLDLDHLHSTDILNNEMLSAQMNKMGHKQSTNPHEQVHEQIHHEPIRHEQLHHEQLQHQQVHHQQYPLDQHKEVLQTFDDFRNHDFSSNMKYEDYDDEFCLDLDQMGSFDQQGFPNPQGQPRFNSQPAMPIQHSQQFSQNTPPQSTPNGYQSSPYQSSYQSSPYQQSPHPQPGQTSQPVAPQQATTQSNKGQVRQINYQFQPPQIFTNPHQQQHQSYDYIHQPVHVQSYASY